MLLLIAFLLRFGIIRGGGLGGRRRRIIDVIFQACWGSDWDYPGSELDADGDIVVGNEAAFTKPDG